MLLAQMKLIRIILFLGTEKWPVTVHIKQETKPFEDIPAIIAGKCFAFDDQAEWGDEKSHRKSHYNVKDLIYFSSFNASLQAATAGAPEVMNMTSITSIISSLVAPFLSALCICTTVHLSHCLDATTARAISIFTFAGRAPSDSNLLLQLLYFIRERCQALREFQEYAE